MTCLGFLRALARPTPIVPVAYRVEIRPVNDIFGWATWEANMTWVDAEIEAARLAQDFGMTVRVEPQAALT